MIPAAHRTRGFRLISGSVALALVLTILPAAATANAGDAEDAPVKLSELKCFIMPKRGVEGKKVVDWKEGKLYLCCTACVKRVEKYPERYAAGANHQLLQTGQYMQAACPISGGELASDAPTLTIGGVEVKFANAEHKKEVESIEEEKDQVAKVFRDEAFEKAFFKPVPKEEDAK
ncbi:MAG: hypothetical protein AAF907_12505 [Planctomycetota bacterium]